METEDNDPTKEKYFFGRDYRACVRLNALHWLAKMSFFEGQCLHPGLLRESSKQNNLRVADIGTGTAIWAIEAVLSLPQGTVVHSFDISDKTWPRQEYRPKNLHLHLQDCFKPFPESHLASYDIVHLRFFHNVLNGENINGFLTNIFTLLKPGGYLQWFDLDARSTRAISPNPSVPVSVFAVNQLATLMQLSSTGRNYEWLGNVHHFLQDIGFTILHQSHVGLPNHYRWAWHLNHLVTVEEIQKNLETSGEDPEIANATRSMIQNMSEEFEEGVQLDAKYFRIIARKPLPITSEET